MSGGGDPEVNPTLRTMFQKARDNSIPMDTIDRAIKRGTGELEGVTYEEVTYEGYAPGGVAVMVDVLTDNRNRAGADIRNIFTKNGGSMAEPGAVAWQFDRKGTIVVPRSADEEELMLTAIDAGAEDIVDDGDTWRVIAAHRVARRAHGPRGRGHRRRVVGPDDGAADLHPLDTADGAKRVLRLIDALDEHDDVQAVHANFDIPDTILETVEAAP